MRFSIIIPVYNAGRYLDECIQSVLGQTYTDFEIILVDDGSQDGSGAGCDRWAETDSRIRAYHQPNGGASVARNTGIGKLSGQYVLFLDADDYWMDADVLARLDERLTKTCPDVLSFNLVKIYEDQKKVVYFSSPPEIPEGQLSVGELLKSGLWISSPCNKAIRSELFTDDRLRFRAGITSEDIDWCLRLALAAERLDYTNVCVVGYRQRNSSSSGSTTPGKTRQLLYNTQECIRLMEAAHSNWAEELRPYVAYQYGTLLYNIALLPASPDKKELIREAKTMAYVLHWSEDSKIRLIRRVKKIVGFRMTLCALWLKAKVDSIRQKRSD